MACSGGTDLHSRYCGGLFNTDTTAPILNSPMDNIPICGIPKPLWKSFYCNLRPHKLVKIDFIFAIKPS